MAIKGAKTIAEYAIRKWMEERFETGGLTLTMDGNRGMLRDGAGDVLILVYDPKTREVYAKEE